MGSLRDGIIEAGRAALCAAFDYRGAITPGFPSANDSTPLGIAIDRYLKENACPPKDPYVPPAQDKQFQCPIRYNIFFRATELRDDNSRRVSENVIGVWGPLDGFKYRQKPDGTPNAQYVVTCRGQSSLSVPNTVPSDEVVFTSIFSGATLRQLIVEVINITSDDAEDIFCTVPAPPRTPVDPNNDPYPVNIPYDDGNGNNFILNATAYVGYADVDLTGNLIIPVRLNIAPEFSFAPAFNFSLDVNFDFSNDSVNISPPYTSPNTPYDPEPIPPGKQPTDRNPYKPKPAPTGDGSDPEPPTDAPDPPDDVPDPDDPPDPTITRILGVLVTTVDFVETRGTGILSQDTNPDIYFPDMGIVSFRVDLGGGKYGWTEDIRVKNKRQFIPCPWSRGAVQVAGTPRLGTDFVLTPVRGKVPKIAGGF